MGQAMETIAADVVFGGQAARDSILCSPGWHSVMKGRIKDRYHRHPGPQHSARGPHRRQGRLVVQGSQIMQRVNGGNDGVIQAYWLDKAMSSMHDPMADGIQAPGR